ncbi:MAG: acyltransferase [Rhodoferax sp.]|nr:acyltransferase [Rhodoferax sp.]
MTPKNTVHVGYLDGWRGMALLFLLIGHFLPIPGINMGHVGVFLFFVLSGYLMSDLLFIKHTPIALFYKRRISRIFPALICYIACVLVYYAAMSKPIAWDEVFGAILFLNYPQLKAQIDMPTVGHIWSLSIEEHAYILLSFVAVAARSGKVKALWLITALAAACVLVTIALWPQRLGGTVGIFKWLQFEAFGFGLFLSAHCCWPRTANVFPPCPRSPMS